jgi:hypothetical protein
VVVDNHNNLLLEDNPAAEVVEEEAAEANCCERECWAWVVGVDMRNWAHSDEGRVTVPSALGLPPLDRRGC